ncbi:EPIDERMAL PATTERNING FACTOR-like protein 9, partial [Quillaja saponaria]
HLFLSLSLSFLSIFASTQTHIYPSNIHIPFKVSAHKIKEGMANTKLHKLLLQLFTLILAANILQGYNTQARVSLSSQPQRELNLQGRNYEGWTMRNYRRLMIGSTAPTCTYNECRGCKYRCRAEQVPVEGNDPINSAYHYRCVCHR